jgi:hypothetical protein
MRLREIEREPATPEAAADALRRAEDLHSLSDPPGRDHLLPLVASAAAAHFRRTARGGPGAAVRAFVPAARALPAERWATLFDRDAELRRSACEVLGAACEGGPGGLLDEIRRAEEIVQSLEPVGDVLRSLEAPLGSTHVSVGALTRLAGSFRKAGYRSQKAHVLLCLAAGRRVARLAHPSAAPAAERVLQGLEEWGSAGALRSLLRPRNLLVLLLVLAGAVALVLYLTRG